MKNIELVIFDMDGLMFDTERISCRVWSEVLAKHGYHYNFEIFSEMIGSNLERIKAICIKHYGADFPFDEIKLERYDLTNKIIEAEGLAIKKGLIELLAFLYPLNIKTALATSSGRDRATGLLNNCHIEKYFDYILCGDEVSKSKPDPEIFLTAAKKLSCSTNKTIVLEDSDVGIKAAYDAGMIPILIPDIKTPSKETLALAYQSFPSLLDFKAYLQKLL